MDSRAVGSVVPEGMPETASSVGAEQFLQFPDPHHHFLFGNGGALGYAQYQNDFTFPDANLLNFHPPNPQQHQHQHQHLPYESQSQPAETRHIPATISPADLEPASYAAQSQDLSWEELSAFSNGSDTQMGGLYPTSSNTMVSAVSIPTANNISQWSAPNGVQSHANNTVGAYGHSVPNFSNALRSFPWATLHHDRLANKVLLEALEKLEAESEVGDPWKDSSTTKTTKRSSAQAALPPSPAEAAGAVKRAKTAKTGSRKVPHAMDPTKALQEEVQELLENDLLDDVEIINKYWKYMEDAGDDRDKRLAVVRAALESADSQILTAFGDRVHFPGRIQKWCVSTWKTNPNDPLIPALLQLLMCMSLRTRDLESSKLTKVANVISRKAENTKTRALAEKLLNIGEDLEQKQEEMDKKSGKGELKVVKQDLTPPPTKQSIPVSNPASGMKRKMDEQVANAKGEGLVKKPNVVPTKSASPSSQPTQKAPMMANPPPATSVMLPSSITTVSKPKPTTSTSAFFKAMQANRPATSKPPAKPLTTSATDSPRSQGFSSIFDQLKERQKRDEEEAANRAKAGADKLEDDHKKSKKKKTVRWKTGEELEQIQVFEILEPEGEYYGGGSGQMHQYADARSLEVSEGRDAKLALKNRKLLEEEDDDDFDFLAWYQPIVIDFTQFQNENKDLDVVVRRGGLKTPESEEAVEQARRETGILSVQYRSVQEIPFSPAEPIDGVSEATNHSPTVIPIGEQTINNLRKNPIPYQTKISPPNNAAYQAQQEPDKNASLDLSSLLSQLQRTTTPQPTQSQTHAPNPAASVAAILAQFHASQVMPQPPVPIFPAQPPQQPPAQPQTDINAILTSLQMLTAANAQQQPHQPQQTPQLPQQADLQQYNFLLHSLAHQQAQQIQPQNQLGSILAQLTTGNAAFGIPPLVAPTAPQIVSSGTWAGYDDKQEERTEKVSNGQTRDIRKELREQAGWSDNYDSEKDRNHSGSTGGGSGKRWKKDKKNKNHNVGGGESGNRGKVVCKYFLKNKCDKGDSCTFLHANTNEHGRGRNRGGGGGQLDAAAAASNWVDGLEY